MAAAAATTISFSLLLKIPHSKPHETLPFPNSPTPLSLPSSSIQTSTKILQKRPLHLRISAATTDTASISEAAIEKTQQIVASSSDDSSVSTVVSALLFTAFIALSLLTIGVVYLAVQDFLQKREREKFEKEEAAKKKGGKKAKVRARTGPRGFGQKIEDDDDDDDD